MSEVTQNQQVTQNQNILENINSILAKNFEKRYNAKPKEGKERVVEIVYNPKWDLKQLISDAIEYAQTGNRVIRILGVYSLDFGKNVSVTVLPSGNIRFTVMLGFRIGVNYPNAIDITPSQVRDVEILIGKVKELIEKLGLQA